jgi:hypothetical protein
MPQRRDRSRSHETRRRQSAKRSQSAAPSATRIFGPIAEAGAGAYARMRDLPRLIALWPDELADLSLEGHMRILAKLRRALRAERRRAVSGHWSYDLNRHLGLLSAYKGELAGLRVHRNEGQPARACRVRGLARI